MFMYIYATNPSDITTQFAGVFPLFSGFEGRLQHVNSTSNYVPLGFYRSVINETCLNFHHPGKQIVIPTHHYIHIHSNSMLYAALIFGSATG